MQYQTLGNTGLKVSALGFGASSLGGMFKPVSEASAIRCVHLALELGINYIDVAPFYGDAETLLGKALRAVPRDAFYLATKVGRYGQDHFDFSAARTDRSVDESLRRTGADYIDIIQVHDLEYGNLGQIVDETLPALRRIQEQGKVRFLGITGYPLKAFQALLAVAEVDTILSYNRYSLNDTALESLLPFLERKELGIINAAPVSQGLLTNQGPPAWHPAPDTVKSACKKAASWCRSRGADIAELAIQFSAANPRIHTTVFGTANPENVRKAARCIEKPMDLELLDEVRAILAPVNNISWNLGVSENK